MDLDERMKLKPRIVAVLGKNAQRDVLQTSDADMVEVRLDLVEGDPLEVMRAIHSATSLPLIATNRWSAEGGRFRGTEKERVDLLIQASDYADFVDIELRAELMGRIDKPMIVSYHDFTGMPSPEELKSILVDISETGASIAKIAVTPCCLRDNLTLLELLLKANIPLCVIAMGELGRHMRGIAPIYGSVLAYGYVSETTAPGQMSVGELKQLQTLLGPLTGVR
jgi:3-dehydroquinate dehydratase I